MVACADFGDRNGALGAFNYQQVLIQGKVKLIISTLSLMPGLAAFKACVRTTLLAESLTFAGTAWFPDNRVTVSRRAPLEMAGFTDDHILINCLKCFQLLRSHVRLHGFVGVPQLASFVHALNQVDFTSIDS